LTSVRAHEEAAWDESRPYVLVVDDLEANLKLMRTLLERVECNVVFAQSGNDALRQLLKREFAVMLLDVQMPGMDGFEVARHARQNPKTSDTPIIFVTAMLDTDETVLKGYGTGAVDFLFKPVNVAALLGKVRVFLELFNGRRELQRKNAELDAAYRELQATHSQLVQAAKMAALGQLVAGIAHEINNPLAFTSSHLGTVTRKLEKLRAGTGGTNGAPAEEIWGIVTDRLKEMDGGLARIKDLVLKLRTFSRLDEGETQRVRVRESVDSILTIFGHRLGQGVRVCLDVDGLDEIECSAGLFNQAVANLVSNSLDVMPEGGVLTIRAGCQANTYAISVSDTGPGIPPAQRERVLEPFFTTKPVGQGTGLGLSIAYSVVRKHGGTIDIGDAEGGGARITIRLPLPEAS
jgi:two-component system NtrC family sensor kinase